MKLLGSKTIEIFKEVLKDGNYLTLDEYLELEKYAFDNFLEFVPNQNGFGHMTDWLEIPEYARFAECPDGFEIWGSWKKPSTFNPLDEVEIVSTTGHPSFSESFLTSITVSFLLLISLLFKATTTGTPRSNN